LVQPVPPVQTSQTIALRLLVQGPQPAEKQASVAARALIPVFALAERAAPEKQLAHQALLENQLGPQAAAVGGQQKHLAQPALLERPYSAHLQERIRG
jgi:hypothetical protein